MGFDRSKLSKDVSDSIIMYPYRDIPKDEWPVYFNSEGKWVPYDQDWRRVGYKVPYPTITRLQKIDRLSRHMNLAKKKVNIASGDIDGIANYYINNLIQGLYYYNEDKEKDDPESWGKQDKEWLYQQFTLSGFLLDRLNSEYQRIGGKIASEDEEEEQNFTNPSEPTLSESIEDTEYE